MAEWHDGYAKAMEHTHDTLDQLGVPREANGAKLYIHERIRALRPVHVGWICKDDLATLLQVGAATVYQERQEFKLLPEVEQRRVFVERNAGVAPCAEPQQENPHD